MFSRTSHHLSVRNATARALTADDVMQHDDVVHCCHRLRIEVENGSRENKAKISKILIRARHSSFLPSSHTAAPEYSSTLATTTDRTALPPRYRRLHGIELDGVSVKDQRERRREAGHTAVALIRPAAFFSCVFCRCSTVPASACRKLRKLLLHVNLVRANTKASRYRDHRPLITSMWLTVDKTGTKSWPFSGL